jgi:hypothetical protein
MTETEKLIRDIETLRESLQHDWVDLGTKSLSSAERHQIQQHIDWATTELKALYDRLIASKADE